MDIPTMLRERRWKIVAILAVMAIIWRLLYICQAIMNVLWMNAAIVSMAVGERWLFRPLGLLALTVIAGLLTVAIVVTFIHPQRVAVQGVGRRKR